MADPILDADRLRAAVVDERRRVTDQIADLETSVTEIVEASELTSSDDEHDPEGTTIAYERAQATALLQQARDDLVALDAALERIDQGTALDCSVCGGPIAMERLLALPGVATCIECAN